MLCKRPLPRFCANNKNDFGTKIVFGLNAVDLKSSRSFATMNILPPSRELLLFITAALVLLITPGPSVLYIVARSVDQGRKAGLASSIGIYTGGLVHVMAATCGLSALLVSSAVAYSFVKYAGALYLIYLGIRKLREDPVPTDEVERVQPASLRQVYTQGALVQIFNPKTAIFFLAFLPQFVNPARGNVSLQFLALGLLVTLLALVTDSLWAMTAGSAAGWLQRNKTFLRNEKYVSGTVYIGLGLVTAASGSKYHVLGVSRTAH
jgi:threonine/homoserine/homoserine lactone efflux protein